MQNLLLATAAALAAVAVSALPAQAQSSAAQGFTASNGSPFGSGFVDGDRRRHDRRRHRDDGDLFIGEWPQQGDTAWRANGYNDWWHDRPDRSYPAWVQRNQNCERVWWSGGNWRC